MPRSTIASAAMTPLDERCSIRSRTVLLHGVTPNAVSGASRDLKFRVSGTITEYRGRNYILLEKIVVIPDASQQF